jgi:hypothetical protein
MPITPPNLDQLDPAAVAAAQTEVTALVQEPHPEFDLRRGVLQDLLIEPAAALGARAQAVVAQYQAARSLKAIEADPTLAAPDLVDDVLSNYRVTRQPGGAATGSVTVVLSAAVTTVIAQGSIWEAAGQEFTAPTVFTAKLDAAQVNTVTDRLITQIAADRWAFTIDLVASAEGPAGALKKNTQAIPRSVPPNFVTAYAAADFTGGVLAETNQELLTRLQEGVAARALSNRVNMQAALRAQTAFARAVTSIIGFGDAEMLRDRRGIFPVSTGGRADWYVRTQPAVQLSGLAVTATLLSVASDGTGAWQFALDRDSFPGFYEVRAVRPPDSDPTAGGYTVTADVRGIDLTGTGFIPDVLTATEAAYSRYQTSVIQFAAPAGKTVVGATEAFEIDLAGLPQIADVQAYVCDRGVWGFGSDCLVKAPVPCFVQLSLVLYKRSGDADPDVASLKDALCAAVNAVPFIGRLATSQLFGVTQGFLVDDQTVSAIDMFGRIRQPDGAAAYLRSNEALIIPDDPGNMVTGKTVAFFTTPADIAISVVTAVPAQP